MAKSKIIFWRRQYHKQGTLLSEFGLTRFWDWRDTASKHSISKTLIYTVNPIIFKFNKSQFEL
jgi:hypothetical protein